MKQLANPSKQQKETNHSITHHLILIRLRRWVIVILIVIVAIRLIFDETAGTQIILVIFLNRIRVFGLGLIVILMLG